MIARGDLSSFIVPGGWGALSIWNQPIREQMSRQRNATSTAGPIPSLVLTSAELKPAFDSFVRQLRILFGIDTPSNAASGSANTDRSYDVVTAGDAAVADWEVDKLKRSRLQSQWMHAHRTLASFQELLESAPHIPVAENTAANVHSARQHLAAANASLRSATGSGDAALQSVRGAATSADRAFFDPALVGLLYFPDEHLYAVYTPFFVPVLVPVLTALIAIAKKYFAKRRRQREQQRAATAAASAGGSAGATPTAAAAN